MWQNVATALLDGPPLFSRLHVSSWLFLLVMRKSTEGSEIEVITTNKEIRAHLGVAVFGFASEQNGCDQNQFDKPAAKVTNTQGQWSGLLVALIRMETGSRPFRQ